MYTAKRLSGLSLVVLSLASIAAYAVVTGTAADAGGQRHGHGHFFNHRPSSGPSVARFNLNGYVFDAKYTLGRNTGNTFEQTYTATTVQGVPIAGPFVGAVFPPANYVAMPIGHHELYIAWLDTTNALSDVFVMNFRTHVVYDYAPGSTSPESSGFVTIQHAGAVPIP
jgi:hypothetical protein